MNRFRACLDRFRNEYKIMPTSSTLWEVPMKSRIIIAVLSLFASPAAYAEVSLVQVPVACGTTEEVRELLSVNMPRPVAIGRGGDKQGQEIVILITGSGHWALVAQSSLDTFCVVASGHTWTTTEPPLAKAF